MTNLGIVDLNRMELVNALDETLMYEKNNITKVARYLQESLYKGGKILICGNGGSMAEAQHFAAELVVKLKDKRSALASIALGTNASNLTACGNDYDFGYVFAREVEALAKPYDSLICLSTSGNSPNIVQAAERARSLSKVKVISLTGKKKNALESLCDVQIKAHTEDTARAQEIHLFLLHYLADRAEAYFDLSKKT